MIARWAERARVERSSRRSAVGPRPTRARPAIARETRRAPRRLTSKAEDFVSCSENECWRGVRFGAYLVCDGHGGQAAAAAATAKLVAATLAALDARAPPGGEPLAALAAHLPGAVVDAFVATDADCRGGRGGAGSTATLVLLLPGAAAAAAALAGYDSDDEAPARQVAEGCRGAALALCASVGDSLAFVDGLALSHDHRLDRNAAERRPVWKSTAGLGRPDQTLKFSSSVESKSFWLILGRIDRARRVLEARSTSLVRITRALTSGRRFDVHAGSGGSGTRAATSAGTAAAARGPCGSGPAGS